MTKVSIVVAYAHNRVIGLQDTIPWRVRNDLIHLKELTKDQVVILGRKTYDSMASYYDKSGRSMPAKKYVVITRNQKYKSKRDNVDVATSFEDALEKAGDNDIYVIGGMQIYRLALQYTDRVYATEVDAEIEGDSFFPILDPDQFLEVSRENHSKNEVNEYNYSFVVYEKKH